MKEKNQKLLDIFKKRLRIKKTVISVKHVKKIEGRFIKEAVA
jgi:hypothetical protein